MRKRPNRPIDDSIYDNAVSVGLEPSALDTPERIIEYCRQAGYVEGFSTDIRKLIEDTPGLSLSFEDLGENDAYIKKINDNCFHIAINSKHPPVRQKFSMAHEYIHFQFHRDSIDSMPEGEKILHRNEERDWKEYQANKAAAEILMPYDYFVEIVRQNGGDISRIASSFGVSTLSVRFRAKELGFGGHGF